MEEAQSVKTMLNLALHLVVCASVRIHTTLGLLRKYAVGNMNGLGHMQPASQAAASSQPARQAASQPAASSSRGFLIPG